MKKGLLILTITGLLFTSCGKKEKTVIKQPKKPVVVTKIREKEVADTYTTDGTLVPQKKVNHTLDSQGTVAIVYKKNGDFVKKGEVVVKFTDAKVEANYKSALNNLESTTNNYKKFTKLYKQQMISQIEYLNYKDAYADALARYSSTKSDYNKLTRKSELSGLVGNLDLKVGNIVERNTTIFTVVNEKNMEITVDFPGYWLKAIHVGSPVKVVVVDLNQKEFNGKIKSINPIADPETKKFPIKLIIPNKNTELKDGMYTKIVIPTEKRKGIVVPQESIFIKDLISYVYIVKDGKAKRIAVKTGATMKPYIEVISDKLKIGDLVIYDGIFGLADGDEVIINKETK